MIARAALLAAITPAVLLASLTTFANAQPSETIRLRVPSTLEAEPGSAWKHAVVVTNRGTAPVRLTPRIHLPADWRPLLTLEPLDVPPGGTNLLLLNAVVPPGTRAGTYRISVELASPRGVRRDTLSIAVLPRRAIGIAGATGPRFARTDTSVTVDFVVRNQGNVGLTVDFRARAPGASASIRDSSRLTMGVGDVRYVAVVVGATRDEAPGGTTQLVELTARAAGGVEQVATFEVFRVSEITRSGVMLPLHVRLRVSEGEITPAEVAGVIAGQRDTFELLLRRPGAVGIGFGERDEYRVRWSGGRGRVTAGDVLSGDGPIRDGYELLTGVDATLRLGRFAASSYAGRERLLHTGAAERGAALSARLFRSFILGVGALEREGIDSGDGRVLRAFTSIGGRGPGPPLLRAEVNSGRDGISAYGARAQHRFSRGWFDVAAADLAPAAPARERGSARVSASVGARLSRLLSVRAWGGRFEMDTLAGRPYSYASDNYSAGFSFGALSAEYRRDERDALLYGVQYGSTETSARANLAGSLGRFVLAGGAEMGSSIDANLPSDVRPFQRYSGSVYVNGSARWSGGFSLDYYNRDGLASNQHLSGSVSTSAQLRRGTRLEVSGSVFHVLFPTVESYSMVNARLQQSLGRGGQTVALRARAFATTSLVGVAEPAIIFLEYGVPLGIPIPGIGSGDRRLRARVVEAGSGRAVPNALVRMGDYAAITNHDGRVTLAPTALLQAGGVSVERANASAPLVVDTRELSRAEKGARGEVTITVGEGARLRGRVTRYDRVTRDSIAAAAGVSNVAVTLTRGADTVNTVTASDGAFDVRQLASGIWQVSVSGGELPAAYRFERRSETVVVEPGGQASIEFRVLLDTDAVLLQDGGALNLPRPPRSPPDRPKPR